MTSNIKIYGIKSCDTVKKALKYLSINNIAYEFIDFRVDPISKNVLQKMIEKVGFVVLINKRSTTYRTLTESEKDNVDFKLILKYPTLIKRPVMIRDEKIMVGFSEQKYLDFFS